MLWKNKIHKGSILSVAFFLLLILSFFSSCINDGDECDVVEQETSSLPQLQLSFVIPNANVATRATEDYEYGSGYENQINISGYDYRIYFFSYSENDENGGTLLAEFTPSRTTTSSSSGETLYTVTGVLPSNFLEVSSFRVVVLANWDNNYLEGTVGETTIDDLTEGAEDTDYSTFLAEDKFSLDASNLIPFYGVQEFSGVNIIEGGITELTDEISLLRALAKIEVVLKDDNDLSFSKVILHNYNAQGYSAPWKIYNAEDYHTDVWDDDYVQSLHLVGKENDNADTDGEGISFTKTKDREFNETTGEVTQYETWELYIPEYDNTTNPDEAAYIDVLLDYQMDDDEPYTIYFKNYESDGTLSYDATNLDIYRNNIYRFNVDFSQSEPKVNVTSWENTFDNTWTFGDMSQVIEVDEYIEKDGVMYRVVTSDYYEDTDTYILEVWIEKGQSQYVGKLGQFNIPETVTYLGYTYTVVGISANYFDADEEVIAIDIPATVSYIGDYAFSGCISLESLFFHSNYPPSCGENLFALDDDIDLTIYVPLEMEENFNIEPWNQFTIQGTNF